MLNGYIIRQMHTHNVNMSRIGDYMPYARTRIYTNACPLGPLITFTNNTIKVALVACAKENNQEGRLPRLTKSSLEVNKEIAKYVQETVFMSKP